MNWGGPEFVLGMMGIWAASSFANNWMRARHGYPLEEDDGSKTPSLAEAKSRESLATENAELRAQLAKVNDRIQVLERIATDGSVGVAAQIEALRDAPRVEALSGARQNAGEV